jgi:hypothetical protein
MLRYLLLETPVYYLPAPACVQQRTDAIGSAASAAGIIDRRVGVLTNAVEKQRVYGELLIFT